jgi:hypothetical protein
VHDEYEPEKGLGVCIQLIERTFELLREEKSFLFLVSPVLMIRRRTAGQTEHSPRH